MTFFCLVKWWLFTDNFLGLFCSSWSWWESCHWNHWWGHTFNRHYPTEKSASCRWLNIGRCSYICASKAGPWWISTTSLSSRHSWKLSWQAAVNSSDMPFPIPCWRIKKAGVGLQHISLHSWSWSNNKGQISWKGRPLPYSKENLEAHQGR